MGSMTNFIQPDLTSKYGRAFELAISITDFIILSKNSFLWNSNKIVFISLINKSNVLHSILVNEKTKIKVFPKVKNSPLLSSILSLNNPAYYLGLYPLRNPSYRSFLIYIFFIYPLSIIHIRIQNTPLSGWGFLLMMESPTFCSAQKFSVTIYKSYSFSTIFPVSILKIFAGTSLH